MKATSTCKMRHYRVVCNNVLFIVVSLLVWNSSKAQTKEAIDQLNKNLVGKWTTGSLDKGMFSLVLGEGGTGSFTALGDKKTGENDFCHCHYSSKISLRWKVKRDSLILSFAKTSINEGGASVTSGTDPSMEKVCVDVSCDVAKLSTIGVTSKLKGNYLRDIYILAGNTLEFAGEEYRRE